MSLLLVYSMQPALQDWILLKSDTWCPQRHCVIEQRQWQISPWGTFAVRWCSSCWNSLLCYRPDELPTCCYKPDASPPALTYLTVLFHAQLKLLLIGAISLSLLHPSMCSSLCFVGLGTFVVTCLKLSVQLHLDLLSCLCSSCPWCHLSWSSEPYKALFLPFFSGSQPLQPRVSLWKFRNLMDVPPAETGVLDSFCSQCPGSESNLRWSPRCSTVCKCSGS